MAFTTCVSAAASTALSMPPCVPWIPLLLEQAGKHYHDQLFAGRSHRAFARELFFAFALDMRFPGIYYRQALSLVLSAIVDPLYFKSKHWERKRLIKKVTGGPLMG